jgi:hypothetical protein
MTSGEIRRLLISFFVFGVNITIDYLILNLLIEGIKVITKLIKIKEACKMATKKQNLRGHTGVQSTDFYPIISQEKRILTATLEKVENVKNLPINRQSGAKTQIVYFHQVPRDNNDFLVNVSAFAFGDPNLVHYVMIKNLYVKMNTVTANMEDTEGNGPKTPMFEGDFVLMPNTFLPLVNDYFTMEYQGRTCLFKVTEANPITANSDTAYTIVFALYLDKFTFENSELSKSVVEEYVFEESRIGTDSRTIFRSSEYEYIQDLKIFYNDLAEIYLKDFYDPILSTFLCTYDDNVTSPETINNFTVITENGDKKVTSQAPKDNSKFVRQYLGKRLYDAELIDFIKKNNIFHEWEEKSYTPTQFAKNPRPSKYSSTVFYALEKQEKTNFKSRFFIPLEVSIASTSAQPVMFGTVNLIHVSGRNENTLDLLPHNLFDLSMMIHQDYAAPEAFTGNIFEQLTYAAALHIAKFEEKLFLSMVYFSKQIEEIRAYEDVIPRHEAYYLFPIVAYLIKNILDNLISKEIVNKYKDPKDYIPK